MSTSKKRDEFITTFITALLLLPLNAWILMLCAGGAHHSIPAIPAFGYGTAVLLVLGVAALAPNRQTKP